jgi:hypothetical protein
LILGQRHLGIANFASGVAIRMNVNEPIRQG